MCVCVCERERERGGGGGLGEGEGERLRKGNVRLSSCKKKKESLCVRDSLIVVSCYALHASTVISWRSDGQAQTEIGRNGVCMGGRERVYM